MTDIRILIELEIKVSLVLRTTIIIEILDFNIPLSNCYGDFRNQRYPRSISKVSFNKYLTMVLKIFNVKVNFILVPYYSKSGILL